MIKYFPVLILFSILLFGCKNKEQEHPVQKEEIIKTEPQQTKFCFIQNVVKDSLNCFLLFKQVEYKKKSSKTDNIIIEMPDGSCFSNKEDKPERLEIKNSTVIIMQTFSFTDNGNFNFNQKVNPDDFIKSFSNSQNNRFKLIPFRLVFTGTKIDSLFEIYIP